MNVVALGMMMMMMMMMMMVILLSPLVGGAGIGAQETAHNNAVATTSEAAVDSLMVAEDYFSNRIVSLTNECIDLTEKFKMGIQIDDSIRDKFEATLDESGIDCNFLENFSKRMNHLIKSHIMDCPDEKLNKSVDESFDLDRLKEDASIIFEALSAFELYEDMNQTIADLFHCSPSTTVSKVQN